MKRKLGIAIMIMSLLAATLFANVTFADNKLLVKLNAQVNEDKNTITVVASMENNHGFAAYNFDLNFDPNVFTVENAFFDPVFEENGIVNTDKEGKIVYQWANAEDYVDDGILFAAIFRPKEEKLPVGYTFSLSFDNNNICTSELKNVEIEVTNIDVIDPGATPTPAPTIDPLEAAKNAKNPFADVKQTDWFYNFLMYTYVNDLFKGTSPTEFSPNLKMTRAMFVTVLYRLAGNQAAVPTTSVFSDVKIDSWYGPAVNWAAGQKLVGGTSPGIFSPEDVITREQMMVIIYNYYKGEPVNYNLTFSDAALISTWAKDAVRYCVSKGIISGREDNTLAPNEGLSRAEASKMFYILSTTLNNKSEPTAAPEATAAEVLAQ